MSFDILHEVGRLRFESLSEVWSYLWISSSLRGTLTADICIRRRPLFLLVLFLLLIAEVEYGISVVELDVVSVGAWLVGTLFLSQGSCLFAQVLDSAFVYCRQLVSRELVLHCSRR